MKSIHLFLRQPPNPDHFATLRSRLDNLEHGMATARIVKRTLRDLTETICSLEERMTSLEAGNKEAES